ncbi:kinase domain protein (macronuclear) [Tetrahymena thermophila SB210]|uniref:Casein kinase I n=1 Tax=Tetrahymena thermophila (strain SB210) TaxID=312017 RepID=I7M336_TETTS|nr:kinase domain protein [Tetrahymena thermophila SB210]EAS02074.2 kinase domain protein [Tetrahymena thermophila SB210]|eukprot:XP_001022319.2 kinase domain protein [Tetrahymena thermophila SB210]
MEEVKEIQPRIIANRFEIKELLGSGSFGEVYLAYDKQLNQEVGLKIDINADENSQLPREAKLLQIFQGGEGIPKLFWSGVEQQSNKNVIAMELLGENLESLLVKCGGKFSLKTVLMLADQMIKRIEYVHSKGFVYRDLKPENFMMGKKGKSQQVVYLIDFGLIKRYKDPKTNKHIPFRDNKGLIGTARYASVNTHAGLEQGRRDDFESLIYLLIYFLKGRLPWQGILAETKEKKYEKLKLHKASTTNEVLCDGLPNQFIQFCKLIRGLKFEDQPNYFKLKQILKELFFELGYSWDYVYDWTELNDGININHINQVDALNVNQMDNNQFITDKQPQFICQM